jgi:hypothetical protein
MCHRYQFTSRRKPQACRFLAMNFCSSLSVMSQRWVVVQFESSHLTIAMEAWKPASLKAMPPQSNIM